MKRAALPNKRPLFITGYSGAGLSSALKILEDMQYEVFDNFPLSLLHALITDPTASGKPLAVVIDTRTRGFNPEALLHLTAANNADLIFITADEEVLIKRFTETRRRHPLAADRPPSAGITLEREILEPLRESATLVIDTSMMTIHDMRRYLQGHFPSESAGQMNVTLMSFGFRYGPPRDADIIMDVRFLSNPHWIQTLRPMTGLDEPVGTYVAEDSAFAPFVANFKSLIGPLLPRYATEGKSYLTIAIGCTGGRHRSVYTVESLREWLAQQGFSNNIIHRDIERAH
jgi:UPF0042 nucleotide-binding protein